MTVVESGWKVFCQINGCSKDIFDYPLGSEEDRPDFANKGSSTPMRFWKCKKCYAKTGLNWGNYRECHPPIIINITDGEATDGGSTIVI
jgi:hypothetical protein